MPEAKALLNVLKSLGIVLNLNPSVHRFDFLDAEGKSLWNRQDPSFPSLIIAGRGCTCFFFTGASIMYIVLHDGILLISGPILYTPI